MAIFEIVPNGLITKEMAIRKNRRLNVLQKRLQLINGVGFGIGGTAGNEGSEVRQGIVSDGLLSLHCKTFRHIELNALQRLDHPLNCCRNVKQLSGIRPATFLDLRQYRFVVRVTLVERSGFPIDHHRQVAPRLHVAVPGLRFGRQDGLHFSRNPFHHPTKLLL